MQYIYVELIGTDCCWLAEMMVSHPILAAILTECEPPVVKQAGNGERKEWFKLVGNPIWGAGMTWQHMLTGEGLRSGAMFFVLFTQHFMRDVQTGTSFLKS